MNRGRRGERAYECDADYLGSVALLQEAAGLWDVRIGAFCLMASHYHLLIHTPLGNLSRFMRHVNGVYTQRYNKAHGQDDQLFRGRFEATHVHGISLRGERSERIYQPIGLFQDFNDYDGFTGYERKLPAFFAGISIINIMIAAL